MPPPALSAKRARLLSLIASQSAGPGRARATAAIRDVKAQAVREPVSRREYVLVSVETDAGWTGIGESAAAGGGGGAVVAAVEGLKKQLLGRDATAYEAARLATAGSEPAPAVSAAQAAVNMALLDITGQAARAPVYQVLGGPTRFMARAAAPLSGASPAELQASLDQLRAAGFRAVFVPLPPPPNRNQGQDYVRAVRRLLERLLSGAGEEMDFVLDCDGALTPGDAQVLAREIESLHLLWLEEPCPLLQLQAAAKISAESATPVGFGRRVAHNSGFQDLLRLDALDVLRPDIARHGITQIRKAAALAETYYVAVSTYHRGGPVATAACLHLAASLPNFFLQEVPWPAAEADRRMRAELVSRSFESPRDGYLPLPVGPGLGLTLNLDAVRKYRAA